MVIGSPLGLEVAMSSPSPSAACVEAPVRAGGAAARVGEGRISQIAGKKCSASSKIGASEVPSLRVLAICGEWGREGGGEG